MQHKSLSYSFVGLWQRINFTLPVLENKFALDLFGDPYQTKTGITPEGFFVTLQTKSPVKPILLIAPDRIQLTTENPELTSELLSKVGAELTKKGINFAFRGYGLNTEHEILGLNHDAKSWIFDNFMKCGVSVQGTDFEGAMFSGLKTQFEFAISEKKYQMTIEPRVGVNDGLFIYVNDHRDGDANIVTLNTDFSESEKTLKTKLLPLINIAL